MHDIYIGVSMLECLVLHCCDSFLEVEASYGIES